MDDEVRWSAVLRRDRAYDGRFFTGVLSTGIYCRPSCAARHPARANVRFFAQAEDAHEAGLRPCKRCRPDDIARDERAVAQAIAAIGDGTAALTLETLGALTGYSPTHFQRVFTRAMGISPAAYACAVREGRAREHLTDAASVTEAIYAAGYSAPSRFYDGLDGKLGMQPGEWRKGGAGKTIHYARIATSVAPILVAATDRGVCCLAFGESEAYLARLFPAAELVPANDAFATLFREVVAAVERPGDEHRIPLDVFGTAFQQRVWEKLREIPPGETLSYGELAARMGNPNASRAVGGANGANRVAVLIPCHRVVAADGSLGGYAWGLDVKAELLRREAMVPSPVQSALPLSV